MWHLLLLVWKLLSFSFVFFFNDTATTEIYTLSLHDALPIWQDRVADADAGRGQEHGERGHGRSEEHTSELQSRSDLVCRLLLEKKQNTTELQQRSALVFFLLSTTLFCLSM